MSRQPEQAIARHIANCRYEQLPKEAVTVAKRSIIDGVAAMVAGSNTKGVDALRNLVERWGGAPEARIFATGLRAPTPTAAWMNGAQMRALELDDCTDVLPVHPTAAVLPSLLALADITSMTGKDFVRALVIAQDLDLRFGLALKNHAMQTGRNDIFRIFAATAGVSAGLGLDEVTTLHALGLSASYGSGDLQCVLEGSMALWIQFGNSAGGALQSCLLAQLGVTGPKAFLVGRAGYFTAFEPEHDVSVLLDGLGDRFEGTRISAKPYASCRCTHAIIDMARSFRERHGAVRVDQIKRVDIVVSPEVYNLVGGPREEKLRPDTSAAAQFSAHFTAATALLSGGMCLADSAPLRLNDPEILELAGKIHVKADEGHRTREVIGRTEMTVHTQAGARFTQSSDRPLGGPTNPISTEMLRAKLLDCVAHSGREVATRDLDRFIDEIEHIEAVPMARALFEPFA
jgi:2-methylcitrate dehydratase PrpD